MTVTDQVKGLLRFSKEARNSDKELYILYLRRAGMRLSEEQEQMIRELPSFETIRRVRQKIQETELQPDNEVARTRADKSQQMKYATAPERVEQILSDGSRHTLPAGYRILED